MADLALPRRPVDARFLPLPSPRDAAGATRRVGVEAEFTGIGARAAARALQAGLGGAVVEQDPHAFLVRGTGLGDLAVELDVRYAHPQAHGPELPLRLGPRAAAWLGSALGGVVPRELITGPMAVDALGGVDRAVDLLRRAGAKGRGATWFGSLGLHFNVDPAQLDAPTLVAALRAFLLLEPWLRRAIAPGRGRRPAAFLPGQYPQAYVRRVAAPSYRPDLPAFVADYLDANPTRDRALDLLPILLHLDGARVRAKLPHAKIGGRPVLHYRLPRAHVGEPGWGIAPDWNRWVAVEHLAADPDRLDALGQEYLGFEGTEESWAEVARSAGPKGP
jgi:Putative amidoligase enzyme